MSYYIVEKNLPGAQVDRGLTLEQLRERCAKMLTLIGNTPEQAAVRVGPLDAPELIRLADLFGWWAGAET